MQAGWNTERRDSTWNNRETLDTHPTLLNQASSSSEFCKSHPVKTFLLTAARCKSIVCCSTYRPINWWVSWQWDGNKIKDRIRHHVFLGRGETELQPAKCWRGKAFLFSPLESGINREMGQIWPSLPEHTPFLIPSDASYWSKLEVALRKTILVGPSLPFAPESAWQISTDKYPRCV